MKVRLCQRTVQWHRWGRITLSLIRRSRLQAAYEHYDRSDSQRDRVLMLLLAYAKDPNRGCRAKTSAVSVVIQVTSEFVNCER